MANYDKVDLLEALAFGDFDKGVLEAASSIASTRVAQMELRRENEFLKMRIEEEIERAKAASW